MLPREEMCIATYGKVECDLLTLLLVVGVEAGLLVSGQLVSQCCRRDLRSQQGDQPVCDCWQLHGGPRVVMCVRLRWKTSIATFSGQQLSRRATLAVALERTGSLDRGSRTKPGTRGALDSKKNPCQYQLH